MSQALSGLTGLAGINAIQEDTPFATPEERMGGPAHPYHSHTGEQAVPYSYESLAVPGARPGPRGLENQLFDDEYWFMESAGYPEQDPNFDYNMPSLTRSHGSVNNVALSGPIPSQYDSICLEISQMNNKGSNLGTSKSMSENSLGYINNDHWNEIWEINDGNSDLPQVGKQFSHVASGFGVNDAASNVSRKVNAFGLGSKHMHRRYAQSPIPGNFQWMRPQGRPLFKTIAGPARPPTAPNLETSTPMYDDPMGTDPIELW